MGTGGAFPGDKGAGVVRLTTHLNLVLKTTTMKLYFHFSTLLGVSRATVSKVMSAYKNHGKTTSAKRYTDENKH
jgi:hypothetical protein